MIIDAHLHVWDLDSAEYAWLGPDLPEVHRTIELTEVFPTLDRLGVEAVVLVQSADNAEDTRNMLRVAVRHPIVAGVVGWVPVEDPARAADDLDDLTQDAQIVGIRNLIHDREDADWVLRPGFRAGLEVLEEQGLPFDFVTADPAALSRLSIIAAERPGLRFVLDHLGKPPINGTAEAHAAWATALRAVAAQPNVVAKVSGLYSSVGPEDTWTQDGIDRVVDVAVDAFGPDRLMYAGDWPMSLRAGGYERVFDGIHRAVASWPSDAAEDLWWRTAARTYRLDIGESDAEEGDVA